MFEFFDQIINSISLLFSLLFDTFDYLFSLFEIFTDGFRLIESIISPFPFIISCMIVATLVISFVKFMLNVLGSV